MLQLAKEGAPRAVKLSIGTRAVHHKSIATLSFLQALDQLAVPLFELLQTAVVKADEDVSLIFSAHIAKAHVFRLWVWVLLHPGPGTPFPLSDFREWGTELPEWTSELLASDYLRIYEAHRFVHQEVPNVLTMAFDRELRSATGFNFGGFVERLARTTSVSVEHVIDALPLNAALADALRLHFNSGGNK